MVAYERQKLHNEAFTLAMGSGNLNRPSIILLLPCFRTVDIKEGSAAYRPAVPKTLKQHGQSRGRNWKTSGCG